MRPRLCPIMNLQYVVVHDRPQPWANGVVFWSQHPRYWDPISKHISNPALRHFNKKKGGAVVEFEFETDVPLSGARDTRPIYLTPYET